MIRVPKATASSFASPDGSTIPICYRRSCWRRGSTGSRTNAIRANASISTCITDGHTVKDAKKLPLNLLDALRALEGSTVLGQALGELVPAYLKLKHHEWNDYARHLTQWERDNVLDC